MKSTLTIVSVAALLSGCQANQSNLQSFVEQTKERAVGVVEPMPTYAPSPKFSINANELRDPFLPPHGTYKKKVRIISADGSPKRNRPKEPLEAFTLEELILTGIISDQSSNWALIKTSEGEVIKSLPGDHLGINFGEIVAINDTSITVKQWFGDDFSGWRNETTTLAMSVDTAQNDSAIGLAPNKYENGN